MKKQFYILALLMGLILIPKGYAFHGEGEHHSDFSGALLGKAYFLMQQEEALDLSEEQVQAIQAIKSEVKKSKIRHQADIDVLDLDIREKVRGKTVDTGSVQKLIDEKYDSEKAFQKNMVDSLAKLKGVLNEKQWETFKALKKESKGKGHWKKSWDKKGK